MTVSDVLWGGGGQRRNMVNSCVLLNVVAVAVSDDDRTLANVGCEFLM